MAAAAKSGGNLALAAGIGGSSKTGNWRREAAHEIAMQAVAARKLKAAGVMA